MASVSSVCFGHFAVKELDLSLHLHWQNSVLVTKDLWFD